MQHRQQALTEEGLKALSRDPTKVVYQPTHDVLFEPWPSRRVETAVRRIVSISAGCSTAEDARKICSQDPELKAFGELYQKFYEKFSTPSVAQNRDYVDVAMQMIRIHDQMQRGMVSEADAKSRVSDIALASLMRQTPEAPTPPASVIEELD